MDVKSEFLHGDLKEEIYMEQPQGYTQKSSLVWRLKKYLYGLKQALRTWYAKMDFLLLYIRPIRCKSDLNVYLLQHDDSIFLIVLYVDDLQMTRNLTSAVDSEKSTFHYWFSITNLGLLHYFLGLEVSQSTSGIKVA